VLLNRTANDLNPDIPWSLPRLKRQYPSVLAICVAPDEIEIGRIQGRQIRALLPKGGNVLCVQGDMMTSAAADRTRGMEEIITGDVKYRIGKVDGKWNSELAEKAVHEWMRLVRGDDPCRLDLVCSQSEMMLPGIRAALALMAIESGDSRLKQLPMTGCDGLPAFKREVDQGMLAATIEIPTRTPPAIRLLGEYWISNKMPPEPEVKLIPMSYPPLNALVGWESQPTTSEELGH
jgi:ABC-type sugar transport system substrate-binding protein